MAGPPSHATARSLPSSSTRLRLPRLVSRSSRCRRRACTNRPTTRPRDSKVRAPDDTSPPDTGEDHRRGHRQRLRNRFTRAGAAALEDYELLELVLFRSIPQRDVKGLAKEMIARFGSLAEVLGAPMARLMEIDGIGESTATDLKIV